MIYIKSNFSNKLKKYEQTNVVVLLESAFGNDLFSKSVKNAFFTGYKPNVKNFVLIYDDKYIVGIAVVGFRKVKLVSNSFKAMTVGPIAIDPIYQGRGLSKLLMEHLDLIGVKSKTDVIYLGGIRDFYRQFDYVSCLSKSKIVIDKDDLPVVPNVTVLALDKKSLGSVKSLFRNACLANTLTSVRGSNEWKFLTKFCKNSYHFFKPQVVLFNGKVTGYFCLDPVERGRIRESVYIQNFSQLNRFLAGLRFYFDKLGCSQIEVMTPRNSVIYDYCKRDLTCVFVEYIKNNAGQLLKILDIELFVAKVNVSMVKYCLRIEIVNPVMQIKIFSTRRAKKNTEDCVFCAPELFPGIVTGHHCLSVLKNYGKISNMFKCDLNLAFNSKLPFIYQGDNY